MDHLPATPHAAPHRSSAFGASEPFVADRLTGSGPGTTATIGNRRLGNLFEQMLDEIDFGMLLLDDKLEVLHTNHVARRELDDQHPLVLEGAALLARRPLDSAALRDALQGAARRGLRRLISLGTGAQAVGVAVVPLSPADHAGVGALAVVLGKRAVCGELAVQWFAQNHLLTQAETRVLAALCAGREPSEIAASHGLTLHTIRTQISSLRVKTGAVSIRELLRRVAMLPPLVSALRGGFGTGGLGGDSAAGHDTPVRNHWAHERADPVLS